MFKHWRIILTALLALSMLLAVIAVCNCANFVDNYQLGFTYDKFSGKIEVLPRTGWFWRNPIRYSVHGIDLRPHQISISANQRVLNAKLVRFDPSGLQTFVEWHGRDAGDNTDNLQEILKCYAFDRDDGRDCPFLTVSQELAPNQIIAPLKIKP